MMKKYPVVTLCGSTRFKTEFQQIQKDLTLQGYIVISVGLFGHGGDSEVWENMDEGTVTRTKQMLDDMHKSKIDMADEIFVVNPGGYIGDSTWSEICYARMCGKEIRSMEPVDMGLIEMRVEMHIRKAEKLAWEQMDFISHRDPYYDKEEMTYFVSKREEIFDPWFCNDAKQTEGAYYPCHGTKANGYDPFQIYGRENLARFVEDILMKNAEKEMILTHEDKRRALLDEVEFYCKELNMEYPKGYPDEISMKDLQDFVECWSEYDPLPELK